MRALSRSGTSKRGKSGRTVYKSALRADASRGGASGVSTPPLPGDGVFWRMAAIRERGCVPRAAAEQCAGLRRRSPREWSARPRGEFLQGESFRKVRGLRWGAGVGREGEGVSGRPLRHPDRAPAGAAVLQGRADGSFPGERANPGVCGYQRSCVCE